MDWYEQMREHNGWLPPSDKVLDAEVRCGPYRAEMDLRVAVAMPPAKRPTWEGSLPTVPRPARNALPNALAHLAQAMAGSHRSHLLEAGAQVRAMAQDWNVWESAAAIPDGRRGAMMRQAVRDLMMAAAYQESDRPELADNALRSADSILHGLWLEER